MKIFIYLIQFFIISLLLVLFKILGYRMASNFGGFIGSFFGPIFGIAITDYYLIKKRKLINKDIFSSASNSSYYYSSGWHIKAIYSLFIGFIFSAATIWNADLRFLQAYSWLIGALISSITYFLLANR